MGGGVNIPPTVLLNSPTQYNQNAIYSVSAYVNGSGRYPSIWFERSTDINFAGNYQLFSGTGSSTAATTTALSYAPAMTGLTPNTTYWIRCKVVTEIATVFSTAISFTTWSLKTASYTVAGTYSLTVPTVSGVNPAALPTVVVIGGGGGGAYSGGGGGAGGLRNTTNLAFTGSSGALTIVVGDGGTAGDGGSYPNGGTGGTSYITGTNFTTYSAGGGTGGGASGGYGGNIGAGSNPAYTGGAGYIGPGKLDPLFGGGGAGNEGNGGAATSSQGGNGGNGNGVFGNSGGGGGWAIYTVGAGAHGTPSARGSGGNGGNGTAGIQAGTAGQVYFTYYGP
jgi:hypothetical protein